MANDSAPESLEPPAVDDAAAAAAPAPAATPAGQEFRAPTGTRDVLAPESARWTDLVATFARSMRLAGYGLVVSPMFEDVGVFARGVGTSTDVVRKEMYDFLDKGGRHVALRPEGTASVVRAFVQHRPATPFKAWYVAPNFRYERPQAGRYRQHHQLGAEALGSADPDIDVELIALVAGFYRDIGLRRVALLVNSLGDAACRPAYSDALRAYLLARREQLCTEHQTGELENPLRVLDCKREQCRAATADAPLLDEYLCVECRAHFARVTDGLDALGITWKRERRLVRGLDYYTRTTFEFAAQALESAQNAVGGGGRYDGLAQALGGPATPGVGFGTGIERVLLALDAEGIAASAGSGVEVFVVDTVDGTHARALTAELRAAGLATDRAFDGRSMKSQMKAADRSGARVAVVVGSREVELGVVAVKPLRGGDGAGQSEVARADLVVHVAGLIERLGN
jgi:histidyl-tRNA synthetase